MPIRDIFEEILKFDDAGVARAVQAEIDRGTDPMIILNQGLIAAMDEVGKQYAQGIFFVPEMLMSGQAMKRGMSVLRPTLRKTGAKPGECIVIGTVQGDEHDIGKNLVAIMLECSGFEVIDLGTDVDPEKFVKTARKSGAKLVAMSALITTTLDSMAETVSRIKSERKAPKTLVGGAPVTREFAERIGADGYSSDAVGAVEVVRKLLGVKKRMSNVE